MFGTTAIIDGLLIQLQSLLSWAPLIAILGVLIGGDLFMAIFDKLIHPTKRIIERTERGAYGARLRSADRAWLIDVENTAYADWWEGKDIE